MPNDNKNNVKKYLIICNFLIQLNFTEKTKKPAFASFIYNS